MSKLVETLQVIKNKYQTLTTMLFTKTIGPSQTKFEHTIFLYLSFTMFGLSLLNFLILRVHHFDFFADLSTLINLSNGIICWVFAKFFDKFFVKSFLLAFLGSNVIAWYVYTGIDSAIFYYFAMGLTMTIALVRGDSKNAMNRRVLIGLQVITLLVLIQTAPVVALYTQHYLSLSGKVTDHTITLIIYWASLLVLSTIFKLTDKNRSDLELLNTTLEVASYTDPLTKTYNRLKFVQNFEIYADMKIKTLSVMMLDIDFFKAINDTAGHKVGDQVLVELAALLKNKKQKGHTVYRFGGEEFVVLMPEMAIREALTEGTDLLQIVRSTKIADRYITFSGGVSQYNPGEDPAEFLDRADKALYQAKKNGRNRVTFNAKH